MTIRTQPNRKVPPLEMPEPITRMSPSEALQIGRIAFPRVTNQWQEGNAFCAIGLINYMRGMPIEQVDFINAEGGRKFDLPCGCDDTADFGLGHVVMHLSDLHSAPGRNGDAPWYTRLLGIGGLKYWSQTDIINWLKSEGV